MTPASLRCTQNQKTSSPRDEYGKTPRYAPVDDDVVDEVDVRVPVERRVRHAQHLVRVLQHPLDLFPALLDVRVPF